jgi:hypothetical protein
MAYIITQNDLDIINQNAKELFSKIELLNKEYKVIYTLEGYLISDSFSISAESNVRRTYSMELVVNDTSLLVGESKKIWMDKYIRPYVGIRSMRTKEIIWYPKGIYTMLDSSYSFDETSRQLSLSCSDLMSELNGDRNGAIISKTKIEEGESVRDVIIQILQEANVNKYIISGMDTLTIPHELEFDYSETYYGMLNTIVELFSYFEMFFDLDGVFVIQPIPHQDTDNIVLDNKILTPLIISENMDTSFKEVYNKIKVWGQSLEADFTAKECTYTDNVYNATIDKITTLDNFTKYSIQIPSTNQSEAKININGLGALYITDDAGNNIPASSLNTGYNIFKYRRTGNNFYWLGQYQVYAEVEETNTNSIFHKNKIGEVVKVCSGDDYDKIYSDSLAKDRAEYELYHACRLQETIKLKLIDIPWLDVNWLIEYKSYITNETKKYVIKQISGSTSSGTMDIDLVVFYDTDPYS